MQYVKDLVGQPGKNAAGLEATLSLLKRFTGRRHSYELSDLVDRYLAFMFVPTLALMALGFVMMSRVPVGRIILGIVWAGHILYFGFGVKTISQEEADAAVASAQEE